MLSRHVMTGCLKCAGLSLHAGKQPGINYNTDGLSTADAVLSGFNSLGIIVRGTA